MIRPFLLSALAVLVSTVAAGHANAGTLNYQGNSTQWQSTTCQQPAPPNFVSGPANDLSANVNIQNEYTRAVNAYLACISNEATSDMNTIQGQVTAQLAQINAAWQADIAKRQHQLTQLRHR